MEDSSDAAKHIEQAHTRLVKEEALRELLSTSDDRVDAMHQVLGEHGADTGRAWAAKLISDMFNESSKVARSETLADAEAREELAGKIDAVRDWIWKNGRPPQGDELDATDPTGRVEIDDRYYFAVDKEGEPQDDDIAISPARLYAEEDDPEKRVNIKATFGYHGKYQLEMLYYRDPEHPNLPSSTYNSAIRPVEEIAENEATIMNGVLGNFIASKITPKPTPSSAPTPPTAK